MDGADPTFEIFEYCRERMDDVQWHKFSQAVSDLFDDGVAAITYGDLMDLIECVILPDDLVERLTANG
jgi:hypothetical protein